MSTESMEGTAFESALEEPVETASSVLLFVGIGGVGAGVSIKLFTAKLIADVCSHPRCGDPMIASANEVLAPIATVAAVGLIGGMLLPELFGGDE